MIIPSGYTKYNYDNFPYSKAVLVYYDTLFLSNVWLYGMLHYTLVQAKDALFIYCYYNFNYAFENLCFAICFNKPLLLFLLLVLPSN